jgi:hypothetical protein
MVDSRTVGTGIPRGDKTLDKFEPQWPDATTKLFKEAHPAYGANIAESSDERLHHMVRGYREAADQLVIGSAQHSYTRNKFVYPIIFLYRQAIELNLKYMLMAYGPFAGVAPSFRSHNLTELWARFVRMAEILMTDLSASDKLTMKHVERQILEFERIDPRSDALRFAHDTQGKAITVPISTVDLEDLRAVIAGIIDFLECADWSLSYDYGLTPQVP